MKNYIISILFLLLFREICVGQLKAEIPLPLNSSEVDAEFEALLSGNQPEKKPAKPGGQPEESAPFPEKRVPENRMIPVNSTFELIGILESLQPRKDSGKKQENVCIDLKNEVVEHIVAELKKRGESRFIAGVKAGVRSLFYAKVSILSLTSFFAVVGAILIPRYLPSIYSRWTGYSYDSIPDTRPQPGKAFVRNYTKHFMERLKREHNWVQLEREMLQSMQYTKNPMWNERLIWNQMLGIIAPPRTWFGGAKWGAALGPLCSFLSDVLIYLPFTIVKAVISIPDEVSELFFRFIEGKDERKKIEKEIAHLELEPMEISEDKSDE